MQTAQRLEDHVRDCARNYKETRESIESFARSLSESVRERRDQMDKLNGNILKILLAVIGAVAFQIAKQKGLL